MLDGKTVWNEWFQRDMGDVDVGGKTVYSFLGMKKSFYAVLEATAATYPNKAGIYDTWESSYTYSEFLLIVDRFSDWLAHSRQVKKGQRIGLLLHNGIAFAVSFYALSKLGAVAVPLPTKYRASEIAALIGKAELDGIVVSEAFCDYVADYEAEDFFVTVAKDDERGYGFQYLLADTAGGAAEKDFARGCGCGEWDDAAILMFTSGTTSASKGVVLKNYNIVHAVMIYQRLLELGPEDRTIIPVPIYHITGLVALLGLFVYIGGTVYLHRRYDARRILKGVQKHRITFMHGSPTVFGLLLEHQREFPALPSIRTLACGSSYLPVETLKRLHRWMPAMKLQRVYGMTETSSPATIFPYDAATSIYPGAEGKPVPGMLLRIADDHGNEVADGTVGTVWLKGTNVCEYYYKTQSPLITEDGWLNTGDVGYVNEDSYVFIVDRKKDMINRGGEKIWCTDVEDELLRIPGVRDAAVAGIPDAVYGEAAAAVVVMESGCHMTPAELKSRLKCRMAGYKIPREILFVAAVPKTPGMKTDKNAIRRLFAEKE